MNGTFREPQGGFGYGHECDAQRGPDANTVILNLFQDPLLPALDAV